MTLTLRKEAVVETETVEIAERALSHKDKCARCGPHVQAYFIFHRGESDEFTFCGHHGRIHEPALVGIGYDVLDLTDQINEKPSPSGTGTDADEYDEDDDDDLWD